MKENRGRKRAVLIVGALVYALLTALGSQIEQSGATTWSTTLVRFGIAFPVALAVLALLLEKVMPRMDCVPREEKKTFCTVGAFALILVCYMPMLLIEYPGSFQYDVTVQAFQVATGQYTQFHPLANTLFLKVCLDAYAVLQSFEKCALLISGIQMLLVSMCFALIAASVSRTCSRRAAHFTTAFFALCPYHWIFASSFVKDVTFGTFFALFAAYMLEFIHFGGLPRGRAAMAVFAGMMACLLRNNMIYAMAVWVVLLLIFGRRTRRAACLALLVAVLGVGVNQGLAALVQAGGGDAKEMLSVPIQQLCRAYRLAPERFTESDMVEMDAFFEDQAYTRYDPTLSDPTKNKFATDVFLEDKAAFFALWKRIGVQCPQIYLDAFLNTALPFLYPYQRYQGTAPYIESGVQKGALTMPFGAPDIVQPRRFEALRTWLDENIWATGAQDFPVLRWVFNAGLVIWLMGLAVLFAMHRGDWARFAVLLLPVLLWGTYLLGPVMQGRYLYPFVCMLPLLLAVPKEGETERTVGALPQVRETRIVAFSSLRFPPRT